MSEPFGVFLESRSAALNLKVASSSPKTKSRPAAGNVHCKSYKESHQENKKHTLSSTMAALYFHAIKDASIKSEKKQS
jgi:hypothetical protein